MPLDLHDQTATLTGLVTVEEVEQLAGWLQTTDRPKVNLRNCTHLHTAAFQALLVFRPKITAAPVDGFLLTRVMPELAMRPATQRSAG